MPESKGGLYRGGKKHKKPALTGKKFGDVFGGKNVKAKRASKNRRRY